MTEHEEWVASIVNDAWTYSHRRWPDRYIKKDPFGPGEADCNWDWLYFWCQQNPQPVRRDADNNLIEGSHEAWEEWYSQYKVEHDRVWVAKILPQFNVWDWDVERVREARKFIRGYACGVCGRVEDPGCVLGC